MILAILFWFLWGVDIAVFGVLTYFFLKGLQAGTVSSRNMRLWLKIMGVAGCSLVAGLLFHVCGLTAIGSLLAAVPAVPGLVYVAWILLILVTKPRWN